MLLTAAPSAADAAPRTWAPTVAGSWIGAPVRATIVRATPGGRRLGALSPVAPWGGGPVGLMVLHRRTDARGRRWVEVRLSRRPNTAKGWIRADVLRLTRTTWRIDVSLARRTLTLYRGRRVVRRARVVVGKPGTPTPRGLFAVAEAIRQPPGGFLGAWALHLTAHSTTLDDFGGGQGRVALHGRGGASLLDPLGTARSHGCVRMDDGVVRVLARVARPGTPVRIR